MLSRRIVTTAVFIPIFIVGVAIEWPGQLIIAGVVAFCSVWGLSEFFNLAQRIGAHPPRLWIYFSVIVFPFVVHLRPPAEFGLGWTMGWGGIVVLGTLSAILFFGRVERAWETILASITGLVYIPLPMLIGQVMRQWEHGGWFLVFAFATTWLSDTGAFFGGRRFGRHKMAPVISPAKTWEGLLSGALVSMIGVLAIGGIQYLIMMQGNGGPGFFWTEGNFWDVVRLSLVAVLLVGTGVVGDLAESVLKRDLGVKDSGSDLTGHGGFLDIMDSLLVNLPVLFVYALVFEEFSA